MRKSCAETERYMKPYSVMVAEDEPLIKENMISKIHNATPCFKVVYAASNGQDALTHMDKYRPDVLITDIQMPVMDGLELIEQAKKRYPDMECIILTGYNEFEYARKAMKNGVQEYLLKPLKQEQICDVLKTIQARLLKQRVHVERNIIVSQLYGSDTAKNLPSSLKKERFAVFLISLGHLLRHFSSYESAARFQECWKHMKLDEFIETCHWGYSKWWLIDDRQPNQKFLILSYPSGHKPDITVLGEELLHHILPLVQPLIVNISSSRNLSLYSELWLTSQKIRFHLEHYLCLGSSRFLLLEVLPEGTDYLRKETADFQDILLNLISTDNRRSLKKELEKFCRKLDDSAMPQHSMEKIFFQLVEKTYRQFLPASEAEIAHLEYDFCEKLALSPNLMGIFNFIMSVFENLLQLEENDIYDPQELVKRVRTFIEQNYTTPLSLESIASAFHFNSSYLTKLFKKYTGETPLKYIIDLRIERAKKLIETQPDLNMKDICTMVGYYDQHYFSRIFKNITGSSPSEYRRLLDRQMPQDLDIHT